MKNQVIYIRNESFDFNLSMVKGQVRTKLGRGPWSYWIDFKSSTAEIERDVPTLLSIIMDRLFVVELK